MRLLSLLWVVAACAAHAAESPPIDPRTDTAWQDIFHDLPGQKLASVRSVQRLFDIHAAPGGGEGALISTREVLVVFDPAASTRVSRLTVNEARRGEASSRRGFSYVYDEHGRLRRIDEDGHAVPAVERRHDAAGRPVAHAERTGAVVARTAWRYDSGGRLLERTTDSGGGARSRETRRYRGDGTLERTDVASGALTHRRVDYDREERPVRVQARDAFDRHETTITYPSATESVHATSGFTLAREGAGRYTHTTHYRVRAASELRGVEAPALPTLRRHVRGTRHDETQTEYDGAGRVLTERQFDGAGRATCLARIEHHPSGPPLTVRHERATPEARCDGHDLVAEIRTDAKGRWTEQRISVIRSGGERRLMAIHTREIDDAP